jgi:hypothetical protein
VEQEGDFRVQPLCILDRKVKIAPESSNRTGKGPMDLYGPEDATWEHEDDMQTEYHICLRILKF